MLSGLRLENQVIMGSCEFTHAVHSRLHSLFIILPHLVLSVRAQIPINERQQWLQYLLLCQGAVHVCSGGRMFEGEQEAAADRQPLWEDVGSLVERFANATDVVVQQAAVELRGRKLNVSGTVYMCVGLSWLLDQVQVRYTKMVN